jgi:hypothetical protein
VQEFVESTYKPIATIHQSDLEFTIPAETDFYVDPNIHIFVSGQLVSADGKTLDSTDHTSVINNLLSSLFSQCSVNLNGTPIKQSTQNYGYRAMLETLLGYGLDASSTHLTNSFWYRESGNFLPADPLATNRADDTNIGFTVRWDMVKNSKIVHLYGRLHSDICNVPRYLLPGIRIQIKLTKSKPAFYLLNADAASTIQFKFLDAKLFVKRIRAHPSILLAHNETLNKGILARYNLTRVKLKSFTFSKDVQSLSIDIAFLGIVPKRLVFTMLKNTDYLGSMDWNPYNFRHYDINIFPLFVNSKQYPVEGLSMDTSSQKKYVMVYNTLFDAIGIYHLDTGLQIRPDRFLNGYFMLLFDLPPDRSAFAIHKSPPYNGVVRIEMRFAKPLPDAITCPLYLEYDNSVLIDASRAVSSDY